MSAQYRSRNETRVPALAAALALVMVALSACSLVPERESVTIDLPERFLEAEQVVPNRLAQAEPPCALLPAAPADLRKPSPRWTVFGDATLVSLEEEALRANPDVSIALARWEQARALVSRSEAARRPSLDAGFGPTRQRTSGAAAGRGDGAPGSTQTVWRAQATIAYEADIVGRVSAGIAAARADAAGQEALMHQALLMVQADVASAYFSLRQLEGERRLLRETVSLRKDGAALLERQFGDGAVARHVLDQASAELSVAQADLLSVEQQYALVSHALATLLGKAPAALRFEPAPLESVTVGIPPGLPSTLLERRPDIAAAERAMAAENARIGVAKTAFFPSLFLTGAFGYESAELGKLGNWSQRTFLFGPLVGTALSMPIFDGGRRKADLAGARAAYEEKVAAYRRTVLQAFREVEDALVSVRSLDDRIVRQRGSSEASARVARSAQARFDEGDADYLLVVDAQRSLLRTRQALIQSEGERARTTVDLVRALGGGWDAAAMARPAN